MSAHACICWGHQVVIHGGHCCLREAPDDGGGLDDLPCGHGDEARAMTEAAKEPAP